MKINYVCIVYNVDLDILDFYRPRSKGDNVLDSIRPSICLSVRSLTAELFDLRP